MTKKAQIMALHAQGKATREIACEVYGISLEAPAHVLDTPMAYVRVVTRQRKGGSLSAYDATWLCRAYGTGEDVKEALREHQRRRYADPRQYAMHLRNCRKHYARKRQAQLARSATQAIG